MSRPVNIEQYISAGIESIWYSRKNGVYAYGASETLAAGSDSGAIRIDGVSEFTLQPAEYRTVSVGGDDTTLGSFIFPPEESPSGVLTLGTFNAALASAAQGTNTYAIQDWDTVVIQPEDFNFASLVIITNSRAKARSSGDLGEAGYMVQIWFNVTAVPRFATGLSTATAAQFTHTLTANMADTNPWGTALALANEGTTAAMGYQFWSPFPVTIHTFISDGVTETFVLDNKPAEGSVEKVPVFRTGSVLAYTTNYVVVTTTSTVDFVTAFFGTTGLVNVVPYQYLTTS